MNLDALTLFMIVVPTAVVILYALSRKANVKASLKVLGTTFSLEASEREPLNGTNSDDEH